MSIEVRRLKRPLLAALAAMALMSAGGLANAGDFERATEAYKSGDYATAAELWRPLAEAGNAGAQYNIGRLYYYGEGFVRDPVAACKWFLLSADNGNGNAKQALVMLYPTLTKAQIARATSLANDWRLTHPK